MKLTTQNNKYSDVLTFTVNKTRNLTKIVSDLFDASDSDWVLDDGDKITFIFPTVHMTKWGWDNVDGSQAKASDLGGYTLKMIDKLADQTDVVNMWYPKDGHVGIHFNKDALRRRMKGDILARINQRNGFRHYDPSLDDSFDAWVDRFQSKVVF